MNRKRCQYWKKMATALAIRLWLEGKEPSEVASRIKHSLKATENYLEKFKRVVYLKRKSFTEFEISRTIGISVSATKTFLEIYTEFKGIYPIVKKSKNHHRAN